MGVRLVNEVFGRLFGGVSVIAAVSIFSANAEAAPIAVLPAAEYYNVADLTQPNGPEFGDGGAGATSAHLSTNPGLPASWASEYGTSNNYSIPRLSASAQAGLGNGEANSALTYYVEFLGAAGDIQVNVSASGGASAAGPNVLNGERNEASASLFIHTYVGAAPDVVNASVTSNARNGTGPGLQTFSINQAYTFAANVIYQVVMNVDATAADDETSFAYADPFFTAPVGYSILTSAGIGNGAAPVSATPIPAALPLFTSALGGLGLLGWRRKKAAAPAV